MPVTLLTLRRAAHASPVAIVLLVAANALPLLGVLLLGWSLPTIVALYWAENGVVGAFALARIATAQGFEDAPGSVTVNGRPVPLATLQWANAARFVLMPFFCVHYGMFWFVHGVFVLGGLPAMWAQMAGRPAEFADPGTILWAVLVLAVSHGASFVLNWWLGGERFTSTPAREMAAPYGRVVVLHVTIVLGAFAVAILGAPIWALVLMVVLKTAADLTAHLAERARAEGRARTGGLTLATPGRTVSMAPPPPPPPAA